MEKKKRLITSALPYVNNIPHLGNLIQVLSADVFARYCRSRGYETLYVCGTDEYGTATETRALEKGVSPRELCDHFHQIHQEIYKWFHIDFDYFGRTSTEKQTEIVQSIFKEIEKNGFITEKNSNQLFCSSCNRFLADRYIWGECPHCGYKEARGDQCESCGKLLDPTELVAPRCGSCSNPPILKETKHLYIDLPKVLPQLESWMQKTSVEGFWANNAIAMTKSWIRDGLKERCITRDLKWGIPVPRKGYENKVFYVWFDAPIGYVSITASHTPDWEKWWKNPQEVELYQFIGKDNIPFHTVIFPSSLLASGEKWTMLHHMSSTEYLNYENGKFSKSKGTGVFGNDAKETGIPADVWRFYIFYNRPEKNDVLFTWKDFQEKVNGELIGNWGNLVNRTFSFIHRFYEGKIPKAPLDKVLRSQADEMILKVDQLFNRADLRDALHTILEIADLANKAFQAGEPWKMRKEDPQRAASLLRTLVYLIRDLAVLLKPYIPQTADKIASFCHDTPLDWSVIGLENFDSINPPEILFTQLEKEQIDALRIKYAGNQSERQAADSPQTESSAKGNFVAANSSSSTNLPLEERFASQVVLKVGEIVKIEPHPQAELLFVEEIDLGEGNRKQIVSGLRKWYLPEDLLGKKVIVVDNLKPAKLRGIESAGMVLAATLSKEEDSILEVITVDPSVPNGTSILVDGYQSVSPQLKTLKIDQFFAMPLEVKEHAVYIGDAPLLCEGQKLHIKKIEKGVVS